MTLTLIISAYLFIHMATLFFLWFRAEGEKLADFTNFRCRDFLWRCHICAFVYVDSQHDELSRCPQCRSFNRREEARFDSLKK